MAKNEANVTGREGMWAGKKSIFTHKNPKTGEIFGEDLMLNGEPGRWVPYEEVTWLD